MWSTWYRTAAVWNCSITSQSDQSSSGLNAMSTKRRVSASGISSISSMAWTAGRSAPRNGAR